MMSVKNAGKKPWENLLNESFIAKPVEVRSDQTGDHAARAQ